LKFNNNLLLNFSCSSGKKWLKLRRFEIENRGHKKSLAGILKLIKNNQKKMLQSIVKIIKLGPLFKRRVRRNWKTDVFWNSVK